MIERVHRATLFALYQFSIAAGIALLPLAMAVQRLGMTLPVHRVVDELGQAYDDARTS